MKRGTLHSLAEKWKGLWKMEEYDDDDADLPTVAATLRCLRKFYDMDCNSSAMLAMMQAVCGEEVDEENDLIARNAYAMTKLILQQDENHTGGQRNLLRLQAVLEPPTAQW